MKKKENSKPVMLYVAEEIYNSIVDIKNKDVNISKIDAIERYIGTDSYIKISSGRFHENLIKQLESEGKLDNEISKLLEIQRKNVLEKFKGNESPYFAKSSFPLSNSQNAFNLLWRMCETYELWCKEVGNKKLIKLNIID